MQTLIGGNLVPVQRLPPNTLMIADYRIRVLVQYHSAQPRPLCHVKLGLFAEGFRVDLIFIQIGLSWVPSFLLWLEYGTICVPSTLTFFDFGNLVRCYAQDLFPFGLVNSSLVRC